MKAQIKFFLENFTDETMAILAIGCALVMGVIVVFWLYNRKKFHRLSHQIPASIVKNYLDSIIQNSTALKSSLFRGGGGEVGEGIPSVVSLKDLGASKLTVDHLAHEELAQKNAEIQSLHQQLADKDQAMQDLESKCQDLQQEQVKKDDEHGAQVKALEEQIADLKDQLASAGGGGDAVEKLNKQIETLQNKLKEYAVIEGELSNLKHLQQENEQLKKSLTDAGIEIPVVETPAAAPADEAPAAEAPADEGKAEEPAEAPADEKAEEQPEAKAEEPAEAEAKTEEAPEEKTEAAPVKAEVSADEENAASETKAEENATEAASDSDNVVQLRPAEGEATAEAAPAAEANAEGNAATDDGQEKSAEELLSEFEKMLG